MSINPATSSFGDNEHINVMINVSVVLINVSTIIHVITTAFLIGGTTMSTLNVWKEVMGWEPMHFNFELSVVVIIIIIFILTQTGTP